VKEADDLDCGAIHRVILLVTSVPRRPDKRRKLMDAWAAYCGKLETTGAEVVPITRRA
jgi:hypothetical protein